MIINFIIEAFYHHLDNQISNLSHEIAFIDSHLTHNFDVTKIKMQSELRTYFQIHGHIHDNIRNTQIFIQKICE
jgi:hypothetical protein